MSALRIVGIIFAVIVITTTILWWYLHSKKEVFLLGVLTKNNQDAYVQQKCDILIDPVVKTLMAKYKWSVATKKQLEAALKKGAQWCWNGIIADGEPNKSYSVESENDQNANCYTNKTKTPGIQEFDNNETCAVNLYGVKPINVVQFVADVEVAAGKSYGDLRTKDGHQYMMMPFFNDDRGNLQVWSQHQMK